jgi:hypothetical protein
VFDLGGAYFGDGEADVCRLLATYLGEEVFLAKHFLTQSRKESPQRPGFEKREVQGSVARNTLTSPDRGASGQAKEPRKQ